LCVSGSVKFSCKCCWEATSEVICYTSDNCFVLKWVFYEA
jgi:hypothetical protein